MGTQPQIYPAPPPSDRGSPLGDLPDSVEPERADFLAGVWVGSSSGFVHNVPTEMAETGDPSSVRRPPELKAFFSDGVRQYTETNGYTLASTLMCLQLNGFGKLSGKITVNRGGNKIISNDVVSGTYEPHWAPNVGVVDGQFTTVISEGDSPSPISIHYFFTARDRNHLDWIRLTSESDADPAFRGTVDHGTLKRVSYRPEAEFNPDFFTGTWVGSSAGFVHNATTELAEDDDPLSVHRPPELAAFFSDGARQYTETKGYTLASTLMCLRLNELGDIWSGKITINRGGNKIISNNIVAGRFEPQLNPIGVVDGQFTTVFESPGDPTITIKYYFAISDQNEIEWIRSTSDKDGVLFRGTVAHGTLRRAADVDVNPLGFQSSFYGSG